MGTLKWIQQWYYEQCDDDWEHQFGIFIETIDNPGWSVKISIENTDVKHANGCFTSRRSKAFFLLN